MKETFLTKVNLNNQTLIDVLAQMEDDLNIIDDAWMLVLKDYIYNSDGEITNWTVREILRADPMYMRLVMDKEGIPARDDSGRDIYFCMNHRNVKHAGPASLLCPTDKIVMERAYYMAKPLGSDGKEIYYAEDEAIHFSKFSPSITYGWPPVFVVWQKIDALLKQDKLIRDWYGRGRSPRGVLAVVTRMKEALKKAWQEITEFARDDPNELYPLAIEVPEGTSPGRKLI